MTGTPARAYARMLSFKFSSQLSLPPAEDDRNALEPSDVHSATVATNDESVTKYSMSV